MWTSRAVRVGVLGAWPLALSAWPLGSLGWSPEYYDVPVTPGWQVVLGLLGWVVSALGVGALTAWRSGRDPSEARDDARVAGALGGAIGSSMALAMPSCALGAGVVIGEAMGGVVHAGRDLASVLGLGLGAIHAAPVLVLLVAAGSAGWLAGRGAAWVTQRALNEAPEPTPQLSPWAVWVAAIVLAATLLPMVPALAESEYLLVMSGIQSWLEAPNLGSASTVVAALAFFSTLLLPAFALAWAAGRSWSASLGAGSAARYETGMLCLVGAVVWTLPLVAWWYAPPSGKAIFAAAFAALAGLVAWAASRRGPRAYVASKVGDGFDGLLLAGTAVAVVHVWVAAAGLAAAFGPVASITSLQEGTVFDPLAMEGGGLANFRTLMPRVAFAEGLDVFMVVWAWELALWAGRGAARSVETPAS